MSHPPYSPDLDLKFSSPEVAVSTYEQLISEITNIEWQHCFDE